jgi:hypothetical protein
LSVEQAFKLAKEHAKSIEQSVVSESPLSVNSPPVFWQFNLNDQSGDEKVGGIAMVDRLDGHIWSIKEREEYMHDYNSIFPS